MKYTAKELADILHGTVEGNGDALVTSFAKIENGKNGQLSFYSNPKYEQYVYSSKASVLLVNSDFVAKEPITPTLIRVENAYTAVAQLLKYTSDKEKKQRRHRGRYCHIACSAWLGKKVYVGDFTCIGAKSRIGAMTTIQDNVTIGKNVTIGENCLICSGARIYDGTVIGDGTILHENCVIGSDGFGNAPQEDGTWKKIEHLGNVIIGSNVEIGACTTVDRAEMESTVIGDGVRIDNLCMIAHNVQIGDNTVMAAMTGIAGSTKVGKNCIFAGQVGTVGHITIADKTTLAAQSGVLGNIKKGDQVYMGSPAMPLKQYLRAYAIFKNSGAE